MHFKTEIIKNVLALKKQQFQCNLVRMGRSIFHTSKLYGQPSTKLYGICQHSVVTQIIEYYSSTAWANTAYAD